MESNKTITILEGLQKVIQISFICFVFLTHTQQLLAQTSENNKDQLTQTIRGTITDIDSKATLPGATIMILGSDPIIGTVADLDGNYKLKNIPVGRVSIGVSFLGFENRVYNNIVVYSGKETILNIELTESILEAEEVEVLAYKNNGLPTNEMAIASVRSISVEEISRLSASFNDPAFITSNFAGVRNSGNGGNDIIIRGNSPKYMQWRLEGIPITNPNHFADQSAVNGSTSTLNSNLLATSDFYTGAFPAEFGNAVSGVYDIKLRNGNNEKLEAILGFGLIGSDITLEGPIKKGTGSSFLVNFRSSTSSILTDLGLVEVEGNPKFQDAAFKFTIPTKKAGIFSTFGLGGYSTFALKDITQSDWNTQGDPSLKEDISEDYDKASLLLNTGIKHFISLKDQSYFNTSIAYSLEKIEDDVIQIFDSTLVKESKFLNDIRRSSLRFATEYLKKVDAKNTLQIGSIYTFFMQETDQKQRPEPTSNLEPLLDFNESIVNLGTYAMLKHRLNEELTITAGIHNNNVFFTDNYTIEPRLAFRWQVSAKYVLNVGYGLHSTMESVHHYFANVEQPNGNLFQPNKNLDLMKAHHFVAGIDHYFTPDLLGRIETYYQYLYDVPVENDPNSYFSTLNDGAEFDYKELVNEGTAKNYGVELTLQKFFSNSYYFLINTSIYESRYTALDGIERNTRFNGNYAVNTIFGKEFANLGSKKNRTLGLNAKFFLGGGQKIIPLLRDEQGNIDVNSEEGTYRDFENAYKKDLEDLYMITISASYKIERAKTSHEIFLNLENITNKKGKLNEYYDKNEPDLVGNTTQFGLLPNLMYRIYF